MSYGYKTIILSYQKELFCKYLINIELDKASFFSGICIVLLYNNPNFSYMLKNVKIFLDKD